MQLFDNLPLSELSRLLHRNVKCAAQRSKGSDQPEAAQRGDENPCNHLTTNHNLEYLVDLLVEMDAHVLSFPNDWRQAEQIYSFRLVVNNQSSRKHQSFRHPA